MVGTPPGSGTLGSVAIVLEAASASREAGLEVIIDVFVGDEEGDLIAGHFLMGNRRRGSLKSIIDV